MENETTTKTHKGFTNYQTWVTAYDIDNDAQRLNEVLDIVRNDPEPTTALEFADLLQGQIEDRNPLSDESSIYVSLLNSAIELIDFQDLARHYFQMLEQSGDMEKKRREWSNQA